jgi:hypothetical protein
MDITTNELKGMKAKQLRKLVRETIQELLAEADLSPAEKMAKDAEIKALQAKKKAIDAKLGDIASGREEVAEGEIEEMARTPKGYRLADENMDTTPYADKRVSGVSLESIINYFRENPGADKKSLQVQFNFARPQISNAVVNALLDAGVLVKLGAGGEVEATPEPGEEVAPKATDPEDLFMGGAEDPLSMYFDGEPNDDGSEDFEPEAGEIEKAEPAAGSMSDEDYEAFMKYDELKRRLDATKSNILKTRKSRGTAGDIADKPSTELQRLRDLKKSLEGRIDDLVAGSDYLKKKLQKDMPPAPPVETPEEEETLEEGLDEWTINKLQYYAGIKP